MDIRTALEILSFCGTILASTWFLSARIQRVEDKVVANDQTLQRHLKEDRQDFNRLYDKLDRKADKAVSLPSIG